MVLGSGLCDVSGLGDQGFEFAQHDPKAHPNPKPPNPQTLNPVNPCLEHTVDPPNLHFPSPIPGRVYSLQSQRTTEAKNPIPPFFCRKRCKRQAATMVLAQSSQHVCMYVCMYVGR